MQALLDACGQAFEPQFQDREKARMYPSFSADQLRLVLRARDTEISILRRAIEELRQAFARELRAKLSRCLDLEEPYRVTAPSAKPPPRPVRLVYKTKTKLCHKQEYKEEEDGQDDEEEEEGVEVEDDWTDI